MAQCDRSPLPPLTLALSFLLSFLSLPPLLRLALCACVGLAHSDPEHHVRADLGPERARRGHGEAHRPAGDQAGDTAGQPAGAAGPHQPADQPAAPGLSGGAAAAVRQTQPRALAVSLPATLFLNSAPYLLGEQLGRGVHWEKEDNGGNKQ